MEPIDQIVDRLDRALRGAGVGRLAPQTDGAALGEISEAVSPYAVPADLKAFWERASFASLHTQFDLSMPRPLDPRRALDVYRSTLDTVDYGPPLLFPIASEDGLRWSIELSSGSHEGGTVFSHGGDFRAEFPSFSDLLEVCAELLEQGRFMPVDGVGHAWLVPGDASGRQDARFAAARANPFRDARDIGRDTWDWPDHWLVSAGFDLRDREPLGTTHTIAEVVDAARDGPTRARVAGLVTRVVVMDEAVRVVVDDGTGILDVWCPAGTSPWGPVWRRRYEFDVRLDQPPEPPPAVGEHHRAVAEAAAAGRLEPAQAAGLRLSELLHERGPAAVAVGVRPLD